MKRRTTIKLKICGMRTSENILDVAKLEPDYMGFIFFKGSKRFVGVDFEIPNEFPSTIKRVGVFVDESSAEILRLVGKHRLDFVQLHGNETTEQCIWLRNSGLRIIKVFSISDNFDFQCLNPYKKIVDYFLFDTKGNYYGGNGVAFNWGLLRKYDQEIPFFLSGGIAPQNVTGINVMEGMNLHSLDVNSGVERHVGIKDLNLIEMVSDGMSSLKAPVVKTVKQN